MKRDEVEQHQRTRLEGAMVEVVARHGFAPTTVRELVTLAGVSKSTFYDHFGSKEECFLAAFDRISAELTAEVTAAYEDAEDPSARPAAALRRFMDLVMEEPHRAAFVTVDSFTLGTAALARRERVWEACEAMVSRYFSEAEPEAAVSEHAVRAIITGTTGVIYRHLRAGTTEELPELVKPLIRWALSYAKPDSEVVRRAVVAAEQPLPPSPATETEALPWTEPPDSPRSRATLSQRERIIRGAARVVAERGYGALSIPAISAAAGTSNQTFYEHFKSKRDPFLAAYENLSSAALEASSAPLQEEHAGPEALGRGLRTLTEYLAANPIYAKLAFFELPTAGPPALDRADRTMDLLISFLEPGRAPEGIGGPAPRVVLDATTAGIWFLIQREIGSDRADSLPELAPEMARLALAPLA
ncbi:MAG TPA: TetR/AcrR family transcriptional regulator [Solirubrobacterales bacterium]|nr:TetR/AcrR family transcriptional regulator [Solirubrobacterales bacterium]